MSLRTWISNGMGLDYAAGWTKKAAWSADPDTIGPRFYDAALMLAPATAYACERPNAAMVDELCEIWVEAAGWLYTIGDIKALGPHALDDAGPDTGRILPAKINGVHIDSNLYNTQGLLPACRLLRHVAGVPAGQRTAAMVAFLAAWAEALARDHAHRLLAVASVPQWSPEPWSPIRLIRWPQLVPYPDPPSSPAYHDAMVDADWMQLQNLVEVRHALVLDPTIYTLTQDQIDDLDAGIAAGIALVRDRIVHTPDGDLLFAGEFSSHPSLAYAGVGGPSNPFGSPSAQHGAGWDVSHYHRVPQMLRALYDARDVLSLEWPTAADLQATGDHYATVPFNGDLARPQFANFSDGTDGWYRVDSADEGYPPSEYGDANGGTNTRLVFPGQVWGWGRLAPFSSKLAAVLEAFIDMINSTDEQHLGRVLYYNGQPWRKYSHPVALFALVAAWPERAAA